MERVVQIRCVLDRFLRLFNARWKGWKRFLGDKDDLEFASMQVVADDDLVAVSFKSLTGFWEEEVLVYIILIDCHKVCFRRLVLVCFELFFVLNMSVKGVWMRRKSGLTLKETMHPPGVHSSIIGQDCMDGFTRCRFIGGPKNLLKTLGLRGVI